MGQGPVPAVSMAEATLFRVWSGGEESLVYRPVSYHVATQLALFFFFTSVDIASLFSKILPVPLLTVKPKESHIPPSQKYSSPAKGTSGRSPAFESAREKMRTTHAVGIS